MQNSRTDAMIIQALRSKGYKATPQRITVCKTALSSREHPNVQNIYREVKKTHPTVSLATIYKTLNILKESGLVQELNFSQGQTRFDPYLEPHINMVCLQCGKIQDLDDPAVKELVKKVYVKANFAPTTQRIDVYGVCGQCSKAAKFK
ncbi:transcriptional repressor [Candidatus Bathyarchaeota archaeon]|nr:transcriptional repressor [Candidatus Bathyarchaeota archaeon]